MPMAWSHPPAQDLVCFADGATPDKWDRVTTGYDKAAIHELGQQLGLAGGLAVEDAHSTGEATLWGEKFEVDLATLNILQKITSDEQKMLGRFYAATGATLFGREFQLLKPSS